MRGGFVLAGGLALVVLYLWGRRGRSDRSELERSAVGVVEAAANAAAEFAGGVGEGASALYGDVARTATGAPRPELGTGAIVPRPYPLGSQTIPGD